MQLANGHEEVELKDGRTVLLRPIRPDDKRLLLDGFERLSEESRYRRFLGYLSALSDSELAYLTEVDHSSHEALGALDPESGEGLGVCRYIRSPDDPEQAEVAVVVTDDWQGRGLGRALLERLSDRARAAGIRRFTALVLADNEAGLGLLKQLGPSERSDHDRLVELDIELPSEGGLGPELSAALSAAAQAFVSFPSLAERLFERARELYEGRTELRQPGWTSKSAIVVGADGSEEAEAAVRLAAELARALGAPLHVVAAYYPLSWRGADEARDVLERARREIGDERRDVTVHAFRAEPASALIDTAEDLRAQLIVLGSSGSGGARRFLLGSVPHKVMHHAPCNVLIVRP